MVTEMTGAEMNILHDLMDQDGDGDLSFKELKYWLENSQDFRHITYRAFVMALKELGFGELRESMMKNIYVACVNDEKKGLIYFDRMYEILHQTDENGVPVAAKMNLSNGGSNGRKSKTISMGHVRVGLHKRDMKATDTGTFFFFHFGKLFKLFKLWSHSFVFLFFSFLLHRRARVVGPIAI
jgi:hypothetical protein